jgi:hypothetical protein
MPAKKPPNRSVPAKGTGGVQAKVTLKKGTGRPMSTAYGAGEIADTARQTKRARQQYGAKVKRTRTLGGV